MLGGVPHGEREHRLRIRGIDDVDEVVVALRVVDRLDLDAQFVELCLGLLDSLRLLACVLRAQISKQHIFHGYLHVMWIVLREDLAMIRRPATSAHAFIRKSRLDSPGARPAAPIGPRCGPPLNLFIAGATNNGSLDRGRSGKAVGLGGIMHQSRPLAAALVCGSIASASGVVVQIAGHEGDGKSVIAAVSQSLSTIATIPLSPSPIATVPASPSTIATVPPSPSPTPSTIVPPPSPAKSAPDKRRDSASPSNSPQTTRLDAFAPAVPAPPRQPRTTFANHPVPAPRKSQKPDRTRMRRNRDGTN